MTYPHKKLLMADCINTDPNLPSSRRASANNLLLRAAVEGNEDLCRIAIKNGASNFNGMLWNAALHGCVPVCCLALECGATDLDNMIIFAAAGGHESVINLAHMWRSGKHPR
jgi:hypothetical protein